ncbi:MAG: prepilin-type N-terminal cleavage/methylation domain-containing protein [Campylobacterota bacterium]|nr:prepilin-type N-terminal cleavage/methylation domain-containing protein [Campylobacterota bacterium]
MAKRKAFTLMEVLVSIALLGIILPALYQSVDMLRDSNQHLLEYLEKAKKVSKATQTLYLDILSSDGNITIKKDEFTRLCMEQTKNSLYALPIAKVCWVVLKKDNTLVRIEGNAYDLPLGSEERVEISPIMKEVEVFDVYHQKDKILVLLQQQAKEPISFMVQGVSKPEKKKKEKKKKTKKPKKKNQAPPKDINGTKSPVPPPLT